MISMLGGGGAGAAVVTHYPILVYVLAGCSVQKLVKVATVGPRRHSSDAQRPHAHTRTHFQNGSNVHHHDHHQPPPPPTVALLLIIIMLVHSASTVTQIYSGEFVHT